MTQASVKAVSARPAMRPHVILSRALFACLGVGIIVWLVSWAGTERVYAQLVRAGRFLPLVFLLEAARLGSEFVATSWLIRSHRQRVPRSTFIRANLVSYSISMTMPAGRVAAELARTFFYSSSIGFGRAGAIGFSVQVLILYANSAIGAACCVAAFFYDVPTWLLLAFVVNTVATLAFGLLTHAAGRGKRLGGWLSRFERLRDETAIFRDQLRQSSTFPIVPFVSLLLGRVCQLMQFGTLLWVLLEDFSLGRSMVAYGLFFIGNTLGELIPAQLGATDGVFSAAASVLGVARADGLTITMLVHGVQLSLVALAALGAVIIRTTSRSER